MTKRISDALIAKAKAAQWVSVTYDDDGNMVQGATVLPKSVLTNETQGTFDIDKRHGQSFRDKRTLWRWELLVCFDEQVILERFEDDCTCNPIYIPRDTANGIDTPLLLRLRSTEAQHPPQNQPSNGTEAKFTFDAQPCRK